MKGHVPEKNLPRYRKLKRISDYLETAGDWMGSEFPEEANKAYALSFQFQMLAHDLREDINEH